jgi:hypothetical protein
MSKKCLLIKTKDKRNLFTEKKNFGQLIEFSKTMGAKISVVKADNPDILSIEELPPAICNSNYRPRTPFEILEEYS